MTDPATLSATVHEAWRAMSKIPVFARWLIRWRFPAERCHRLFLVDLGNTQARFELFNKRPSHTLTGLILNAHNHLPFGVTVDIYRIKAVVQSHQLLDCVQNARLITSSSTSQSVLLPEITLSEQQTNWVRQIELAVTNVRVEVYFRCQSPFLSWEDYRTFDLQASINSD